ncbi:MAG: ribose-phosphate diphosphokinase [Bacilli bacterium]|nr:ribose-phosphate diphosphokinase [Bacilli bacterium]
MGTVIFSISNKALTRHIAEELHYEIGRIYKRKFADGEIMMKSATDVKDKDIIIILSTSKNVQEELFSLLLLLDSVKRAGAKSIKLVMPYFAYSRQERVSWYNEPVSCEVVAKIIDTADFDELHTFDLHHPIIETFFEHKIYNHPTTKLFADYYLNYFKKHCISLTDVVIISPDHGSNTRADMLSKEMGGVEIVIMDKVRPHVNSAEHLEIDEKRVKGKICLIIDDIVDTGGTIVSAANLLYSHGAKEVLVGATHPVFSHNCVNKLFKANIKDIAVTNSIEKPLNPKVHILDIAKLVEAFIK